jgi:hypothetical protein
MTASGLPHSEIPGSKVVCTSPRLIAAYHVLHRLLVPRHPPCALSSLAKKATQEKLSFIASTVLRFSKSLIPGSKPREGRRRPPLRGKKSGWTVLLRRLG